MRKLFIIMSLLVLSAVTKAQENFVVTSFNDTVKYYDISQGVIFNFTDSVLIVNQSADGMKAIPFSTINSASFKFNNPLVEVSKNLRTNNLISGRPDTWAYGALLYGRERMTGDFTLVGSTAYDWFSAAAGDVHANIVYSYFQWNYPMVALSRINKDLQLMNTPNRPAAYDGYRAALLTFRALIHLDWARTFEFLPNKARSSYNDAGNNVMGLTVPVVTSSEESFVSPRATKEDMVAFILSDLDEAESAIEKMPAIDNHELPHLDCVYGLKARLYLWAGNYTKARYYARLAIDKSNSVPVTREDGIHPSRGFNQLSQWMWGIEYKPYDVDTNEAFQTWTNWISPEWVDSYASLIIPAIDKSLYDKIADTDWRKLWWKAPAGSALSSQQTYTSEVNNMPEYTAIKFRFPGNYLESTIPDAAFPIMRIEEMYLIEAEAAAWLSLAEGKDLITSFMKQYRNSAYTCTASTTEELVDEILLQKRIELWGEGQTIFDIKRLNKSVVRSYDGSNQYPRDLSLVRNTIGRPAWMNVPMPSSMLFSNVALTGWENPSSDGFTDYVLDTDTMTQPSRPTIGGISATHQLNIPAADGQPLSADSTYAFLLDYTKADPAAQLCAIYVSFHPDMTNKINFFQDYKNTAPVTNAVSLYYLFEALRAQMPQELEKHVPGICTLYIQTEQVLSDYGVAYTSLSNIVPVTLEYKKGANVAMSNSVLPVRDFAVDIQKGCTSLDIVDKSRLNASFEYIRWRALLGQEGNTTYYFDNSQSSDFSLVVNNDDPQACVYNFIQTLLIGSPELKDQIVQGIVPCKVRCLVNDGKKLVWASSACSLLFPNGSRLAEGDGLCFAEKEKEINDYDKTFNISMNRLFNHESDTTYTLRSNVEALSGLTVTFPGGSTQAEARITLPDGFSEPGIEFYFTGKDGFFETDTFKVKRKAIKWYQTAAEYAADGHTSPVFPLVSNRVQYYDWWWNEVFSNCPVYFAIANGGYKFRIDSPKGFSFVFDASLNADGTYSLILPKTYINYTHSNYGEVYAKSVTPGTYNPSTGEFSIDINYFVSAGSFGSNVTTFKSVVEVTKWYQTAAEYAADGHTSPAFPLVSSSVQYADWWWEETCSNCPVYFAIANGGYKFRIDSPKGFSFVFDASLNADGTYSLILPKTYINYTHSNYGEVYAKSVTPGTYNPSTGEFSIDINYFVSAGSFGNYVTTFKSVVESTVTSQAKSKALKSVRSLKLIPFKGKDEIRQPNLLKR